MLRWDVNRREFVKITPEPARPERFYPASIQRCGSPTSTGAGDAIRELKLES